MIKERGPIGVVIGVVIFCSDIRMAIDCFSLSVSTLHHCAAFKSDLTSTKVVLFPIIFSAVPFVNSTANVDIILASAKEPNY